MKSLAEQLNDLAMEFRSDLAAKIGASGYKKLNGDGHYYRPVDPRLAGKAFAQFR